MPAIEKGTWRLNPDGTMDLTNGLLLDGGDTVLTNTGTIDAAGTLDFGAGTDEFAKYLTSWPSWFRLCRRETNESRS